MTVALVESKNAHQWARLSGQGAQLEARRSCSESPEYTSM